MPAIAQLSGQIGSLTISPMGYSLSREAREKLQTEATAQAIARFRAEAGDYARQFGFGGYTLREVSVNTDGGDLAGAALPGGHGCGQDGRWRIPAGGGRQGQRHRHRLGQHPTRERDAGALTPSRRPCSMAAPRRLLAAGEHMNTAIAPSSSGVVNCSEGSFSASRRRLASSLETPSAAHGIHLLLHQRGQHQPGQMALQVTPVVAVSSAVVWSGR
jgi:hypothetical protein